MRSIILTFILIATSCTNTVKTDAEKLADLKRLRMAQAEYEANEVTTVEGEVSRGQGMFQALVDLKLKNVDALNIIDQLSDYVEFTKLKVGDKLKAKFSGNGRPLYFEFSNNPAEKHILTKADGNWKYTFKELPTEWKTRLVTGILSPSSTLQDDLLAKNLSRPIVGEIVNILLCKINFRMYARSGDQFEVLLRERHFKDQILETKILYTSYSGTKAGQSKAFFYEDSESKSTYTAHYTEEGEALIRSGLRYPLKRLHIRSGYGRRRHPVTGKVTMHRGVDLRGQRGTPVHAVARGTVIESEMTPFGGNKIAIRHADRSVSYYLHLHKRYVKVGQHVLAHQQIGQVGSTGRVTGPHLHFGFKKPNGRWMNPMNKRMIATPKLQGEKFERLQTQIADIKNVLREAMLAQANSKTYKLRK